MLGPVELIIISLFCLGTIVLIALLAFLAFRNRPAPQTSPESLKKCPYCAEMIKEEAVVCRYCGRDLPPRQE